MTKEEFVPKGSRIVLDASRMEIGEIENVISYFDNERWIWGHPMVVRNDYLPGDHFVDVRVLSPQGKMYETSFYPKHLKFFQTKDEIREELLQIRSEVLNG